MIGFLISTPIVKSLARVDAPSRVCRKAFWFRDSWQRSGVMRFTHYESRDANAASMTIEFPLSALDTYGILEIG